MIDPDDFDTALQALFAAKTYSELLAVLEQYPVVQAQGLPPKVSLYVLESPTTHTSAKFLAT